jgi:hypothetical protein
VDVFAGVEQRGQLPAVRQHDRVLELPGPTANDASHFLSKTVLELSGIRGAVWRVEALSVLNPRMPLLFRADRRRPSQDSLK